MPLKTATVLSTVYNWTNCIAFTWTDSVKNEDSEYRDQQHWTHLAHRLTSWCWPGQFEIAFLHTFSCIKLPSIKDFRSVTMTYIRLMSCLPTSTMNVSRLAWNLPCYSVENEKGRMIRWKRLSRRGRIGIECHRGYTPELRVFRITQLMIRFKHIHKHRHRHVRLGISGCVVCVCVCEHKPRAPLDLVSTR